MDDNELQKLRELIKQPVKNIRQEGPLTILELDNGTTIPLVGGMFELVGYELPKCNFCGTGRDETILYTNDDKSYICKSCAIRAIETFATNGLVIDLNLSKIAPALAEQLQKKDNG